MADGGAAQVYVNAGRPIDTQQVKALMRECLAERIRTMLGTREMVDKSPGDVTKSDGQSGQAMRGPVQSERRERVEFTDHVDAQTAAKVSWQVNRHGIAYFLSPCLFVT